MTDIAKITTVVHTPFNRDRADAISFRGFVTALGRGTLISFGVTGLGIAVNQFYPSIESEVVRNFTCLNYEEGER